MYEEVATCTMFMTRANLVYRARPSHDIGEHRVQVGSNRCYSKTNQIALPFIAGQSTLNYLPQS